MRTTLLILAMAGAAAAPARTTEPVRSGGQDTPEIRVSDYLDNKEFKLADLKGRVVLLDFWASW